MKIYQLSTSYSRTLPDPAGVRIAKAICLHENQDDEVDYDLREVITTCLDCGATYNAGEGLWYEL